MDDKTLNNMRDTGRSAPADVIKFSPDSAEKKERRRKVKFPPITKMYEELEKMRRSFVGRAPVRGFLGSEGEVSIDKDFKPLGEIVGQHRSEGTDVDDMVKLNHTHTEVPGEGGWQQELVGMDKLLHFDFGKLHIALEGRPTFQIKDYNKKDRGRIRQLALDEKEARNPSYVFSISEEGGESFMVQVNPDGEVKVLDTHLEDTYKDKGTGEETRIPKGWTTKTVDRELKVMKEVPLTLREILTKIPIKQLLRGQRTAMKQVGTEVRGVEEGVQHFNEFVGGPDTEIELDEKRPEKHDMAVVLITLLKEGLRALEVAELKSTKIPTLK